VEQYARSGVGDARKLEAYDNVWRIRVGEWRAFVHPLPNSREISVIAVVLRRDAY
jgi:hypothetical protein